MKKCNACGQEILPVKLDEDQREAARAAAGALYKAFDWSKSREGTEYWRGIWKRLKDLWSGEDTL